LEVSRSTIIEILNFIVLCKSFQPISRKELFSIVLQVVYFTATFPLLMMLVLLARGITLDGAIDGVVFYLKPNLERLSDVQVS